MPTVKRLKDWTEVAFYWFSFMLTCEGTDELLTIDDQTDKEKKNIDAIWDAPIPVLWNWSEPKLVHP